MAAAKSHIVRRPPVRRIPLKKFRGAETLASLDHPAPQSAEFLVIAAGACAMLLTVGIFDLCGLLS